ncbi:MULTISPECIES: hypothetical protein [Aerococcus]|uniref:hypothetical protein n=1 Tax=Aerococcus TaxID=1375 RepID=UPI0022782750|nr:MULTISPECIES: hypothetical protein [Aerococcus]MCY3067619.1 hypothetical protein [Aerococcus mictus]MCY3080479.1 hypothetical protein [Aerococcus mictus]MDK8484542.1 hypothetical protein [Aerococcus urinae]
MQKKKIVATTLICLKCQYLFPIFRKMHRQKVRGHRKNLYCPKCKEDRVFLELKDYDKKMASWDAFYNQLRQAN